MLQMTNRLVSIAIVGWLLVGASAADAQLIHRYSFSGDASDAVGSAHWTVNGATLSGGQVVFDGIDDYLELTTTPLPTMSGASTTIEVWGTYAEGTAADSRIFDFSTADGDFYFFATPNASTQGVRVGWDDNFDIEFGPTDVLPANTGDEVLLTIVIDDDAQTQQNGPIGAFQVYRNGALIAVQENDPLLEDILLSTLAGTNVNRLGHGVSVYDSSAGAPSNPAFLNGSINEFRVYDVALSPLEVLTNAVAGPDATSVSLTDKTWNAGNSTWATGGNWTPDGAPGSSDRAVISNGGTATVGSEAADTGGANVPSGTLAVASGGSLNIRFPVVLGAGATVAVSGGGQLGSSGVVTNSGDNGTLSVDNGVLRVTEGALVVGEDVTLDVGPGGATFESNGGAVSIAGPIQGTGDVTLTGGGSLRVTNDPSQVPNAQNPNFSGTWTVQDATVDIRGAQGALGTGGERGGSKLRLENGTLIVNTGDFKEVPLDIEAEGDVELINMAPFDNTFRLQGSISGNGVIRYSAPLVPTAIGLDFEDRDVGEPDRVAIDNSGFTGRFIIDDDTATRFWGPGGSTQAGGEEGERLSDFPNAIFEMAGHGAWTGKRGTDPLPIIQLGGVEGIGPDQALQDSSGGTDGFGSRLQSSIAGFGDANAATTYEIGGADEDAEFFGHVLDSHDGFIDPVSVVKVGDNTQAFSGANSYSGTTTVDGGVLLVNGTHQQAVVNPSAYEDDYSSYDGNPVGDYTVNSGGTLGGIGEIGSTGDNVDVVVAGGVIAPGASVGTLTVNGGVSFGDSSTFAVEVEADAVDKLVAGALSIGADVALDVSVLGSAVEGDYVIAEYLSLTGTFASVTEGFSVSYATPGQIILSVPNIVGGLTGDYNENGVVDAADYTLWRDALGTSTDLPNDPVGGVVGQQQYDQWVTNFGQTSATSAAGVPEPASATLLLAAAAVCLARRSRRV